MNKRKFIKTIKRIKYLPRGRYFFLYVLNKVKHFYFKLISSTNVAYPSTIMLELTNHCNLHCTTCPREYEYGKQMDKGFIEVENAKKVIDEVWPYLDSIGLTGMGETFLYKDIDAIVEYIKSKNKGIVISLSTNAMIPDFINIVKKTVGKVDTIQVSIDGLNEIYELIRRNGYFNSFKNNLTELVSICNGTETTVMLNMVVTKENFHQVPELVSFAKLVGIKYLNFTPLNLVAITDTDSDYYKFFNSLEFKDELKKLEKCIKHHPTIEVSGWDWKSKNGFNQCPFPWTHFYVTWDGFLVPCCSKPFPKELNFGNVFEMGVMSCLNSAGFQDFRACWLRNSSPNFCNKCHFIGIEPLN